ncbi:DUF5695 domain-containing protein [Sphingomonas sp. 2R-10]|uniref:DUF5695 domain-containing protein n=1 Tax=Sphingomonas sp. 2R-10 TaxID=3045148 RepID=UPI0019D235C3|nr:DUF5695 domain-containing protein [Sphingomonas sp. 2R-10]MDJ0276434.1 DUF5695 domain-containing protein [Sphingomonas sp. 2R-10]
MIRPFLRIALSSCLLAVACGATVTRSSPRATTPAVALREARVGDFLIGLRRDTQTLARLSPLSEPGFSFVPLSHQAARAGDGYNHLGDLHLRVREAGGTWRDFDSSRTRRPIRALRATGATIAAADITATMGADAPFRIERRWLNEGGQVALRFRILNTSARSLELGAVGMPMVFDNILTGRNLDDAHAHASFVDPYIGRDAGYLQVTRLNGRGPALLVLPERGSPLEAYVPMAPAGESTASPFTDRTPRSVTFEGFFDWTIHSTGYADREWRGADEQWNVPTGRTLAPGEAAEFGVRLARSPDIRSIDRTLAANRRPVVAGFPGYVLPADQTGTFFVKAPSAIIGIASHPAGALTLTPAGKRNGWTRFAVRPNGWGRARLTIAYADGRKQTVSYFLTKPLAAATADLGRFSLSRQWYDDPGDPFRRGPAILSFDREAGKVVLSDHRMWIPGIGDEAGSGSWVAAVMKQFVNPDAGEIARIERFVDETLVGKLQVADGRHAGAVRKSLVWYDRARFPDQYPGPADPRWWQWSWDRKEADRLDRSYNYPHVAAVHWALYRLARNHPGLVTRHDWRWYLDHGYRTAVAMTRDAALYSEFGLMLGDVYVDILVALQREGMTAQAAHLERLMRARADHWRSLRYPFGSEMPWDSTGQPEVYAWMRHFGFTPQAETTRDVILGYDPAIPNWGYNGNARRYWDFGTSGKYERVERQIHHYASALNAVPLLDAFRRNPADLHLLRVAYGGLMGPMTAIDRDGASSTAFHSWPDMMRHDPYSGDFGIGFFGHAYATATYAVDDPTFGWLGFGGTVTMAGDAVTIVPQDGARSRLFVAPAGQWITLEAGRIARAVYSPVAHRITLTLDPADHVTPAARLFVEGTTPGTVAMKPDRGVMERGGFTVRLADTPTIVTLSANAKRP